MSRTWAGGSTRQWRRIRAAVLMRDGYRCKIQIAGLCTTRATCVHHTRGKAAGDNPAYLQSACKACNARVNDPTVTSAHQQVVAWIRAQRGPVTLREIRRRWPHQANIGRMLTRALERGELVRIGRGLYRAGPTGLPPVTAGDPAPSPRTDWGNTA